MLNLLYATTAGIAANNPNAVANNASAIPGATIAKLVFLEIAIDWNEFIIPHTVPNKPIKGAVEPTVATVGSTAPFIGLFGTVWGIMNSFQSIAISRNTSLAIVAPGIAEALFATALGLLAAIPAVVAYNKFNTDSQKYSQKLENFSKRFLTII